MPLQTWRDFGLATTWGSHRANQHRIDESSEWMLGIFQVVPATLVEHLAQDFNGRLRTVRLDLWHIEIIDEDDNLLAHTCTENAGTPLFKSAIDDVLNLVAACLRGESNLNALVLVLIRSVKLVVEYVLDVD